MKKNKLNNILIKTECYNIDQVLKTIQGCFNDPNLIVEFESYGFVHDTGFYVIVRESKQNERHAGTSKGKFCKEFNLKLKEQNEKWQFNIDNGYH